MSSEIRRRRYWTEAEDQELLDYQPNQGYTLHEVAEALGRTYYACRSRRKELRAGRLVVGQLYPCANPSCRRLLPPGRKQGFCPDCRERRNADRRRRKYERGKEATAGQAGRRWERWAPLEDVLLLQCGATVAVALQLKRTLTSCRRRLNRLRQEIEAEAGSATPRLVVGACDVGLMLGAVGFDLSPYDPTPITWWPPVVLVLAFVLARLLPASRLGMAVVGIGLVACITHGPLITLAMAIAMVVLFRRPRMKPDLTSSKELATW